MHTRTPVAALAALLAFAPAFAGVEPPGDDCHLAFPAVVGLNGPIDTSYMTPSANPPTNGPCTYLAWGTSRDAWWSFDVPMAGRLTLDFCSSDFDTSVVVYQGTCGALTRIGCDDDSCAPGGPLYQSKVNGLPVRVGRVFIRVGGYLGAVGNATFGLQYSPGDIDGNGAADGADLGSLLAAWGPAAPGSAADLNGDGAVDGADLGLLLSVWGNSAPVTPGWATPLQTYPDPAVVTDPALRAAIVATRRPWRVLDTATQIELLLVPPGTFQMGCIMGSNASGCYAPEMPVHTVTLTQPFYLGRYEVTQAQWQARMGSNPSYFRAANGFPGSDARPVERVSWTTIQGYLGATGMRLPTEAEWEFACRAGTQTPFYNGSTDDGTVVNLAWYGSCCGGDSGGQTHAVGGKAANAFGFHDMLGNVWEWVNDWAAYYSASAQTDPTGPASGLYRVIRGGSWYTGTDLVRSSNRNWDSPGDTFSYVGFRVARTP